MIDFETYHELRRCRQELQLTPVQIAEKLKLDIKTVRKYLAKVRYEARARPARRASKLDPYKEIILAWLEKYAYSGVQIFQRLRAEHGYTGGKSVLNQYLQTLRPLRREAFLKLAFAPGDCLQVDWGTHERLPLGDTVRRLHYFCAVLCH